MRPCAVSGCSNPGCGRAQAGDLCVEHWQRWIFSEERQDLGGARIAFAADAWFRFLDRQAGLQPFREVWAP